MHAKCVSVNGRADSLSSRNCVCSYSLLAVLFEHGRVHAGWWTSSGLQYLCMAVIICICYDRYRPVRIWSHTKEVAVPKL